MAAEPFFHGVNIPQVLFVTCFEVIEVIGPAKELLSQRGMDGGQGALAGHGSLCTASS